MNRILPFLLVFLCHCLHAQEMRVVHCTAISQQAEVFNFYVDEENNKWAGTSQGLYRIHSADNASKVPLTDQLWSLLQQPGGNKHLIFNHSDLFTTADSVGNKVLLDGSNQVSAAYFDDESKDLWIGTTERGVYRFATRGNSGVEFVEQFDSDNSRLKSNRINTIFVDQYGKQWIGTTSGVLVGNEKKWRLYEKGSNIQAITEIGPDVWIMSEDVLFMADPRNRWIPGDFDLSVANGSIKSIRFDSDGRLWSASDIITRYDVVEDKAERFGRAEGFSSREVRYITVDRENALWVGTADKGLFLIEKESAMTVSCEVSRKLSCEGRQRDAALKVKIIGGLPPYKYRWTNGLRGDAPEGLGAGLYTVTVTDSEDRQKVVSARVDDVDLKIDATILKQASGKNLNDGAAQAVAEGGRPDYGFRWDNGETSARAVELTVGQHKVTVTDANGCEKTTVIDITAKEAPKVEELVLKVNSTGSNRCADDQAVSLSAEVTGGMTPYKYQWSQKDLNGPKVAKLAADTYSLTVTDALGNSVESSVTVEGPSPLTLKAYEAQPASRDVSRDGRALVKVSGGSGEYTYIWDNGESKQTAVKLTAGEHSVTVLDANNCKANAEVNVTVRQIPELDIRSISSGQIIRLEKLYFDADSSRIKPESTPMLNELSRFLRANTSITIEVGGHTNNIPETEYCDRLSTARAKSVVEYLQANGVDSNRLNFKGYGKRKPIASNKTVSGRRRNQRVEVKILSVNSG
ncbi:MAG: OmpA family protein [Bacteroidota bacterium]